MAGNDVKLLSGLMSRLRMVDLTHVLEEHIPAVPTHSKYKHSLWNSYRLGDRALTYEISLNEHTGTHVDAPSHFIREGEAHVHIHELPLQTFMGPYVKIDLSFIGPTGEVTAEHFTAWEAQHGEISPGDIVLIDLGWAQYWKKRPDDKAYLADWPGLGRSAAEYLVTKRVKMVGVDTINVDRYGSAEYPAHYTLLGNGILIMENLNRLQDIPERGYFLTLPLYIKEGSGSPIRAIALFE